MITREEMREMLIDLDDLFYAEEGADNLVVFKAHHPLAIKLAHLVCRIKDEDLEAEERLQRQRIAVYDRP